MAKYLRVLVVENFVNEESFVKNLLKERIISRLVQMKVTSVLVDQELNEEDADKINSLHLP
ncbi:MAG: hypothetical protein LBU14_04505 [Candidatus Peribacteria bacterium]|nr:hypothetical protein [Candidatus Peribacteria bacterium]